MPWRQLGALCIPTTGIRTIRTSFSLRHGSPTSGKFLIAEELLASYNLPTPVISWPMMISRTLINPCTVSWFQYRINPSFSGISICTLKTRVLQALQCNWIWDMLISKVCRPVRLASWWNLSYWVSISPKSMKGIIVWQAMKEGLPQFRQTHLLKQSPSRKLISTYTIRITSIVLCPKIY